MGYYSSVGGNSDSRLSRFFGRDSEIAPTEEGRDSEIAPTGEVYNYFNNSP